MRGLLPLIAVCATFPAVAQQIQPEPPDKHELAAKAAVDQMQQRSIDLKNAANGATRDELRARFKMRLYPCTEEQARKLEGRGVCQPTPKQ